ncbi:hypothetical protein P7H15_10980 [Paenibacillus larvae]|nr:hypothetical protein [Paenibacillus larvae]MDT2293260.1 hypothetical protein [Paenibacillus larvae]
MICPFCGDEMEHWNQGIYECKDCEVMIPDDIDDDYASEIWKSALDTQRLNIEDEVEIEAYKTTVKGVRRLLKVWLIRLGSLTDVVLYDTKETALSA